MANHFGARVYGMINGAPPYADANGQTAFSQVFPFVVAPVVQIQSAGYTFWPLPNGTQVGGAYVYSVIVAPPTGLNVHGTQYVSDQTAAQLATSAG